MSPQPTKTSKVGKPRSTAKNPSGTKGRKPLRKSLKNDTTTDKK